MNTFWCDGEYVAPQERVPVVVRLSRPGVERLDQLAVRWGVSRSEAVRRLLAEGVERHGPVGEGRVAAALQRMADHAFEGGERHADRATSESAPSLGYAEVNTPVGYVSTAALAQAHADRHDERGCPEASDERCPEFMTVARALADDAEVNTPPRDVLDWLAETYTEEGVAIWLARYETADAEERAKMCRIAGTPDGGT